MSSTKRGWRSRGHLPHADFIGLTQAITFRLADSLPNAVLRRLRSESSTTPSISDERRQALLTLKIHDWLDAGHGSCALSDIRIRDLVLAEIRSTDHVFCRLDAVVVMPNHVHVLAASKGDDLGRLIGRWKGRTSRAANVLLGRTGPFWQREYFDRFVRDDERQIAAVSYVAQNPVKAGLVADPWTWKGLWVAETWRAFVQASAG